MPRVGEPAEAGGREPRAIVCKRPRKKDQEGSKGKKEEPWIPARLGFIIRKMAARRRDAAACEGQKPCLGLRVREKVRNIRLKSRANIPPPPAPPIGLLGEAEAHGDVVLEGVPGGEVVARPGLAAVPLHPQAR